MNTRKGRAKFKKLRTLLESGCSSTILMRRVVEKLCPEKYAVMQSQTQARNTTTNFKFKVYFTLPALSVKNVVMRKCRVYDSARDRYDMILGRYILTELGLNQNKIKHVIEASDGSFIGSTAPMVDLGAYLFKYLNTGKLNLKICFTGAYFKELYESEHVRTDTKILQVILDAKYEKANLHKVMKTQFQHLTMTLQG